MQFSELTQTLRALPLAERIAAMEVLWDTLDSQASLSSIPAHHQKILDERIQEIDRGETISWADAKLQLSRLSQSRSV